MKALSIALAGVLLLSCVADVSALQGEAQERPYLGAARGAALWLEEVALETPHGIAWPVVPGESDQRAATLYSGAAGVVLFFVELAAVGEGDAHSLEVARRGADELIASLPEVASPNACGLYTGVAGVGFALLEVWRATGDDEYRVAAVRVSELLHAAAVETDGGVKWSEVTDVIAGAAGTGLYLLESARRLERPEDLALAAGAGRELLARATVEPNGCSWAMAPDFPRRMPNFSHGTAGIATFLAELHEATGEAAFLEGAQAGASHLLAIAERSEDGLRIHHHTPDGEELFYLGWCHGPVGTARLFEALDRQLDDESGERAYVFACARALRTSGIPAQRTPGFWDNVGICCGSAGVAEFFLSAALEDQDDALSFARSLADDVLARATEEDGALRWIQAEHRARPELLQAQTGLMQGAAGVGLMLLHLHGKLNGRVRVVVLPDDPF